MSERTKDQSAISLWDRSAVEKPIDSPMTGDIDTDVAIIGGGFTGLSTALHLAEKGVKANVLEAEFIGYGGSGRNVGLVNPGLWLPPQDVRSRLGVDVGDRFMKEIAEAPAYVFSLIEKYGIQCEATQNGTLHAAHSRAGFEDLQRRIREWNRLKAPVELLDRQSASKKIGSDHFYGALLDHRAGTINPMGYVRGLARSALSVGAGINTGVKVQRLFREGDKWQLETSHGRVTANSVIIGTNAYSDDLWPDLKRCFTIIYFFQFATEPMSENANHILPGREGLWDTGSIMFSLRRDQRNRVIVGSMGRVIGGENGLSGKWARTRLRRLFPSLGEVKFDAAGMARLR